MSVTGVNLEKHVRVMTDKIGIRLAGSPEEYQAAEYIAGELKKYCPVVSIEEFEVKRRLVTKESLEIFVNGEWKELRCSLFSSAASTDGKVVEGELVCFDTATSYQRKDLRFLNGKAVIHLGCHIENEENYRRLMEAKPAFILFVDVRYPGPLPLGDGLFPAYVKKYGSVPSLNVAYMDIWNALKEKASKARICVEGSTPVSKTTVVWGEIPGTDPDSGVIYCGGHHDTQAGTVGANDNAIGSAAVIELARLLSGKKHKRSLRFMSFGAEEQLSAGSAAYVRAHREEITRNGIFMCNLDSFGTRMGWGELVVNATAETRSLMKEAYNGRDLYYVEKVETCPYTDQFPFAACGVPGCWVGQKNCASGNFFHHREDNSADVIDYERSARWVEASADLMGALADREDLSGLKGIPEEIQKKVNEEFNTVYGGF